MTRGSCEQGPAPGEQAEAGREADRGEVSGQQPTELGFRAFLWDLQRTAETNRRRTENEVGVLCVAGM